MTGLHVISGAMALLWVILASLQPRVTRRHQARSFWAVIFLGVPVLGWLTLHWGPVIGVAAFVLGLCLLLFQPLRPRRGEVTRVIMCDTPPPGPGSP
ncbi:DUF2484 family protein [Paracoccus alkanivorans]|uniref:DUF2484 family protein n=1 Tax=Paracoccus alkanivorans TaxID=2116655 RepID=A0A3M0ML69_9RHOB|nr:DUF2484 family protein [Paracoccus alkanivorans]RMC36420.1 DUF2484 family protein [Paracoccus alkanivorans]